MFHQETSVETIKLFTLQWFASQNLDYNYSPHGLIENYSAHIFRSAGIGEDSPHRFYAIKEIEDSRRILQLIIN